MTRPNPDFNSLSVPDSSQRKIPADVRAVFFDIDDTFSAIVWAGFPKAIWRWSRN